MKMILTRNSDKIKHRKLPNDVKVTSIVINQQVPAIWKLDSDDEQFATCLSCVTQPCISYQDNEIGHSELKDFASSSSRKVCATNAITWPEFSEHPVINEDDCINCGVCAERCPAKAIYLSESTAIVNHTNTLEVTDSLDEHNSSLDSLKAADISGHYLSPSQKICEISLTKIEALKRKYFLDTNLLVRNLLNALGVHSIAYRQGVQYSTIDVLGVHQGYYIAVEVELDNSLIDTPRNLITSAAILYERHNWVKSDTKFLSIGLKFPNKREEFWNVLDDINDVLGIKINFSTILSLFFLIWLRQPFKIDKDQYFIYKTPSKDIRSTIGSTQELKYISKGFLGILEPEK